MAKRKLLQWMRDRLCSHADKVVVPVKQHRALEVAYGKASPLVRAMVEKKFPPADMKVLKKYGAASVCEKPKIIFADGSVAEFKFQDDDGPLIGSSYDNRHQMYQADAKTAAAVDAWRDATEAFKAERTKRLAAYKAMIQGSSTVDDVIAAWPEAKGVLPAGSPPIALGPEQFATIKADQAERRAA